MDNIFFKAIDDLIAAVDCRRFPSAIDPDLCVELYFEDRDRKSFYDLLKTAEGKKAYAQFYKVHRKIVELVPEANDIENITSQMENAAEFVPLAVGFAAGLRAAGVSKQQARMMLAGYLRHFRKD